MPGALRTGASGRGAASAGPLNTHPRSNPMYDASPSEAGPAGRRLPRAVPALRGAARCRAERCGAHCAVAQPSRRGDGVSGVALRDMLREGSGRHPRGRIDGFVEAVERRGEEGVFAVHARRARSRPSDAARHGCDRCSPGYAAYGPGAAHRHAALRPVCAMPPRSSAKPIGVNADGEGASARHCTCSTSAPT